MWNRLSKIQKIVLCLIAVFIFYTLFGFFAFPKIVNYYMQKGLSKSLNRVTKIENVTFNPFKLELQISNLFVESKEPGKHLLDLGSLVVNLELASLPKRALILSKFKITEPQLYLKRKKNGKLNIDDLLHSSKEEHPEPEDQKESAKFSINNIELINGNIDFIDDLEGAIHEIENIQIGLPFISNLKHYVDIYVKPHLSFVLNGTPFEFKGSSKPFKVTRETSLNIDITKLDLTHYVPYLPESLRFNVASGFLDTDLTLNFSMAEAEKPVISLNGTITASDIALTQKDNKFFSLKEVKTYWTPSNLMDMNFHLSKIEIDSPRVVVTRYKSGELNLQHLVATKKSKEAAKKEPSDSKSAKKTQFLVDKVVLKDGVVQYSDQALSQVFSIDLNNIAISIENLTNKLQEKGQLSLATNISHGGKISVQGEFALDPMNFDLKLDLSELNIQSFAPYYQDQFNGKVASGQANINSRLLFSEKRNETSTLKLADIAIAISDFQLDSPSQRAIISIPSLEVQKGLVDIKDQKLEIGLLALTASKAILKRKKDGSINFLELLPVKDQTGQDEVENNQLAEKEGPKWSVNIGEAVLRKCELDFEDRAAPQIAKIKLAPINLKLADISLDEDSKFDFKLEAAIQKKGKLKAKGKASVKGDSATATIDLIGIPLPIFQPYLVAFVNGSLTSGVFDWHGTLKYRAKQKSSPVIFLNGNGGVRRVALIDAQNNKKFLSCTALLTKGLQLALQPLKVKTKEVIIQGLFTELVIDEQGELNLKKIFKITENGQTDKDKKGKKQGESDSTFEAEIALLTIKDSNVIFKDFSIEPPFEIKLSKIQGNIKGLSSEKDARAEVLIEALINESAKLKIAGKVNPLATPLFADLKVDVQDVGMPLFTPYAGKYIGYLIQKGKLNLDLHYKVDKDHIKASNRIFLDQLTLGEHVKSPDAPNLPIRLALSLLTDRKGRIKLNVPVEGKLDDPNFSIRGAVWRAVTNLIIKAATSPFALLGAVFGGGEDLQVVPFEAGKAVLGPEAQKRLEVLKKALNDRPKIKVELTGRFDPEADSKALLEKQFELAIKKEKFNDMSKKERAGLSVEEVSITPEERPKYLWKAYKHARFKKPKHLFGIVKKQPPEVMEKMMKEHIKISAGDLRKLGMDRAEAVKKYLVQTGGIDPKRIFIVEPKAVDPNSTIGPHVEISLK